MPTDLKSIRPDAAHSVPDQRFGRDRRLRACRAIDEAFNSGVRFAGQCMVMWLRKADDAALRAAVVASKRTFRRAVDRNRAKRRLREAFRRNRSNLRGQADLVLVARQALLGASFAAVERDLMKLAGRAELAGPPVQKSGAPTKAPGPGRGIA